MKKIFLMLLWFASASPCFAQMPGVSNYFDYDRGWYADPLYDKAVRDSRLMLPGFSFFNLRLSYMQSGHYEPVANALQKTLSEAAETALASKDTQEIYKALATAQVILHDHIGNLAVVKMAETLGKRDKRLGSPKYYAWLRNGIIESVKNSGDGTSPEDSYGVLTQEEETQLLYNLGVKILNTETVQENDSLYNMYEVEKPGGKPYIVFIDATYPLSYELKKAREKAPVLDLTRQ